MVAHEFHVRVSISDTGVFKCNLSRSKSINISKKGWRQKVVLTSIPCLAPFSLPATPRGQPHPNQGVLLGRGSNQQHSKVYALPNVWTFFFLLFCTFFTFCLCSCYLVIKLFDFSNYPVTGPLCVFAIACRIPALDQYEFDKSGGGLIIR